MEIVRILQDTEAIMEVESEEAEEAIEILLHELDHWEDGEDTEGLAEN